MALAPGSRLGPYEITAPLGAGGMGEVYRGRDTRLDREVAIKVLPPAVSADPERRRRFRLEARAASALAHPHVCTLYDIGTHGDTDFLVMEYLPGESLTARMAAGPLVPDEALRLAGQIAGALAAAHAKGIVHRDLKPDNIRLGPDGGVKVLDFGLAKILEPEPGEGVDPDHSPTVLAPLTGAHVLLGTAGYMSPEQARGTGIDARTDVWAFGVVVFEMLSGRSLFGGKTAADCIASVLQAEVPWSRLGPGVSPELRALLARCLDRDPARRPAGGAELSARLQEIGAAPGASGAVSAGAGGPEERSIVVLPFANLSPDPDNEYFSDGLTEEVISDLSKVEALRVMSRTSSMRLKGSGKDLGTIGRELGVRYALEGSVRKAGTSLRITAQLVDTRSDRPLWSEKYGGTLDDVFEIQERVSRAIVEALRVQLSPSEERNLKERPFQDGFVYDLYLRARRDIQSMKRERVERARSDLESALRTTGENVLIYRGLAMASWQMVNAGFTSDPRYLDEAEAYGRKILALDPDGPHGHVVMGYVAGQRGARRDWLRHFRRAAELDPGDTESLIWLCAAWICAGRFRKADAVLERAEAIDPLYEWIPMVRGIGRYLEGRFEEARSCARRGIAMGGHPGCGVIWVQASLSLGDAVDAEEVLRTHAPDPTAHPLTTLAHLLVLGVHRDREGIDRLATGEFRESVWVDMQYAHMMSQVYAQAGDVGEGFRWLAQSVDRGLLTYRLFQEQDPLIENLRGDPRFAPLMERVRREWETFEEGL